MDKKLEWDKHFLKMARLVSERSKDTSTKCGCVLVSHDNTILATGYNGFPRGIEYDDPAKFERPEKYYWMEHSERNAIYNAANKGVALAGTKAYVTGPPCHDCTRGLIQAGIFCIIIPLKHNFLDKAKDARWGESCDRAQKMMKLCDVEFRQVDID